MMALRAIFFLAILVVSFLLFVAYKITIYTNQNLDEQIPHLAYQSFERSEPLDLSRLKGFGWDKLLIITPYDNYMTRSDLEYYWVRALSLDIFFSGYHWDDSVCVLVFYNESSPTQIVLVDRVQLDFFDSGEPTLLARENTQFKLKKSEYGYYIEARPISH